MKIFKYLVNKLIIFVFILALGIFVVYFGSGYTITVFKIAAMTIGCIVILMSLVYLFYSIMALVGSKKMRVVLLDEVEVNEDVDMKEGGFIFDYQLKGINEDHEEVIYTINKKQYEDGAQVSYAHGGKKIKARVTINNETEQIKSVIFQAPE